MGSGPKKHRQRRHISVHQHTAGKRHVGGNVRIIGGEWRGRKLPVVDLPGLRPTGDRVRETLFNWLQGKIHGARCVDLFAGSGALGFEAASRGAGEVTLVERSRKATENLRKAAEMLGAEKVRVVEADALAWLSSQEAPGFDVVFIDPPFESELAADALETLMTRNLLAPGGLVYLESPRLDPATGLSGWTTEKEKVLGDVRIQLLKATAGF